MFFIFRNFLVVLLVSLQWISPLVHAHINATPSLQTGLHIPGLENYGIKPDTLLVSATSVNYAEVEGLIIGIDAGIKTNQHASNDAPYLPSISFAFKPSVLRFAVNFSPHPQAFVARFFLSAHSPRAPPFV